MDFRIADTFTDSLTRLTNNEQKAVKTTAFDLQTNPANPGMQFHKLGKAKDKNFWSVRVGSDIRLIVHKSEASLVLCYVDHHDKAYDWAERRKLEAHPKTGAAQLVEIRETVKEIVVPIYVEQEVASVLKPTAESKPLFAGVSEDDLLSYLWFGRPSYALTSGQSQAFGTALAAGIGTLGLSRLSNQLGTVVTQGLGLDFLDYLSITQQDMGVLGAGNVGGAFSTTVVETGFYVADDVFLTLLFRPLGQGAGTDRWPGLRFEWEPSEAYTIESYFEDRFFRGRAAGFGELGVQRKGLGLSLFREWAY